MNKYIWANILAAVLLISLTTLIFFLKGNKHKILRRVVLLSICSLLLLFKTTEYIYYQAAGMRYKVPLEFSQVAYFIFPISVLLLKKGKILLPISTYCAIIAGFFYDLSWIVSAKSFFERDTAYQMFTALFCHNTLYFGGMLILTNEKLPINRFWRLPLGVAGIVGWHYLMHSLVNNEKDIVLKSICEAKIIDFFVQSQANKTAIIVFYYIIVVVVLISSFVGLYAANNAFTRKEPLHNFDHITITKHTKIQKTKLCTTFRIMSRPYIFFS